MAENGQRLVAELTEIGVIAANADYSQGLPGALTFGARRTGAFEVLLRFDPVWRGPTEFEQAFLLFEPAPGTHASAGTTPVAVWRIDEPWNRDELSWRAQPELTLPKVEGLASANGSPLRLDVTPLIQYLKRHPEHDHGMAVRAQASDGLGVSYASGVLGGTPPYVEVYSR